MNRGVILTIVVLVMLGGYFAVNERTQRKSLLNGRIEVVASFYPLSYIAEIVGGDLVSVRDLVPAGVEPHDFEPSPRDFAGIADADILLFNGASFEPWVEKWQQSTTMRPTHVINMADELINTEVVLIERGSVIDPHFWLDPVIMKKETEIIRDALVKLNPLHKEIFERNTVQLLNDLDALDAQYRVGLSACSLRDVVVLHEAFSYLARQYRFSATSIEGISPDEEPSPRELARIISFVREKGVKTIFSETIASPKFSEVITREIGGTMLVLNPLESLTPNEVELEEDYISIMKKNLENLQKAMQCTN